MFYLCSVESKDLLTVFGSPATIGQPIPAKYPNLQTIMLGQKQEPEGDISSYLLFADTVVDEFRQHQSIPERYDFIFRQEWGLRITEEILHRVIETLRKESYPPMADYLDAVVKDDETQKQKYIADCLAVKQKYPKFSFNG